MIKRRKTISPFGKEGLRGILSIIGLVPALLWMPSALCAAEADIVSYPVHLENRVLCPLCRDSNLTSKVFVVKCWLIKAREMEFYDEDGDIHYAVRDMIICQYECSREHKFKHKIQ